MKKIILAAAACFTIISACSKIEDTSAPVVQNVTFSVAQRPDFGADTKAVKTDWAVGDEIAIAFKPTGETVVRSNPTGIPNGKDCELVTLTMTESGWIAKVNETAPNGSGTYYAIHHRGSISMKVASADPTNKYVLGRYKGGELMSYTGTYTTSEGILDLGEISMALDSRIFQVSIPDDLFTNDGNMYLCECTTSYGSDVLDNPENTIVLSIYKNWDEESYPVPSETFSNHVALRSDAVSLDFEEPGLFVFSSADNYKTKATPVLNNFFNGFDYTEFDYSFCFADTSTGKTMAPAEYVFYIERIVEDDDDYTFNHMTLHQTVPFNADTRNLKKGRSYRLSNTGWIGM